MKKALFISLIASVVVFAQPTKEELKLLKAYGDGVAIGISHKQGISKENILGQCFDDLKLVPMSVEKNGENLHVAALHCQSEWKRLKGI